MKTVIEMAKEAGFREPNPHDGCMGLAFDYRVGTDTGASLERLVELVRADEREACARVCESQPMRQDIDVRDQCAAAIRARRPQCQPNPIQTAH